MERKEGSKRLKRDKEGRLIRAIVKREVETRAEE